MKRLAVWLLFVVMILASCGVIKVKKPPQRFPTGPLKEFTFEAGNPGEEPAGWKVETFSQPGPPDANANPTAKLALTDAEKNSGDMSAVLRRSDKGIPASARICGHSPFPGQPLRVSAFLKTGEKASASLMVGVTGQTASPLQHVFTPAPKWTEIDIVIVPDTPHPAKGILELCISFSGSGEAVWIDDVTITKAELPASPGPQVQPVLLENLDMERFDRRGNLDIWAGATNAHDFSRREKGELPPGYQLRADRTTKRSGSASLLLTATDIGDNPSRNRVEYCMDPAALLGKTVRVAGWMETDVGEGGGATFGIAGSAMTPEEMKSIPSEELMNRPLEMFYSTVSVFSSIDWTRFEQIGFVASSTKELCLTVGLGQVGSVWLDDVTVEVIEL